MQSTTDHPTLSYLEPQAELANEIADFVHEGIDLDQPGREAESESFWSHINDTETALWLDSGDIDAIDSLWCDQFEGLTTNNSLLNEEVQRGTYDDLVPRLGKRLETLDERARVREIAFALNVRHALTLVQRFRCQVSVELHTDLANDTEATLAYARRCHQICPSYFIVKVPLTPAGLIAIGKLRDEGIRVNCTVGFSARQNYLATAIARPSFVNVFLGRLNSYVSDNGLGDGELVGEKATIASQQEVSTFTRGLPRTDTQQIAASLRSADQLGNLTGVDVITMPTKVAEEAKKTIKTPWQSRLNEDYSVSLGEDVDDESVRLHKLWHVSKQERNLVQKLILNPPKSASALVDMAKEHEVVDLFPEMSEQDFEAIAEDGKIPRHERWQSRIAKGDLAIDSLMTLAAIGYFADAQQKLDARIEEQLKA